MLNPNFDGNEGAGFVQLFHATNRFSAESMLVNGMGLDESDYQVFKDKVIEHFDLRPGVLDRIEINDPDKDEHKGSVSFLPRSSSYMCREYGTFGGECRGSYLARIIKRACRYKKIPWKEKEWFWTELVGAGTECVFVEAFVPVEMIANPKVLGTTREHYTFGKVPPNHIKAIHTITPDWEQNDG